MMTLCLGIYHDKKEGYDGLMWHTHIVSWPLILCDGNMIGCYHDKKEGDEGLMWCTNTGSWTLIREGNTYITSRKRKKGKTEQNSGAWSGEEG
eukprot:4575515-Ditylum_brightwellii.AAC.1